MDIRATVVCLSSLCPDACEHQTTGTDGLGLGGGPDGDSGAPYLNLRGDRPLAMVTMGVQADAQNSDRPFLNMRESHGGIKLDIGVNAEKGTPYVKFADQEQRLKMLLDVNDQGFPSIKGWDDQGSTTFALPTKK